jgi:hypothetical protein
VPGFPIGVPPGGHFVVSVEGFGSWPGMSPWLRVQVTGS